MRGISLAIGIGALLVGAGATAQSAKQVEVTNLPVTQNVDGAVEVTNLPAVQDVNVVSGGGGTRFEMVGWTTPQALNPPSPFNMTAACQAEFPGSRVCTYREAVLTTHVPPDLPPPEDSPTSIARLVDEQGLRQCGLNTSDAGKPAMFSDGTSAASNCTMAHPIACCALR